jgi:hypothetical protein
MVRRPWAGQAGAISLAVVVAGIAAAPIPAAAQECRVLEFDLTPTADLQMVIWLEDVEGAYVDTAFITRTTGTYGLGNRPGIMDFKSGPWWPYGRRLSTFPVWAHRHGLEWPAVVFQDGDDDDLSHQVGQSSTESVYCRPIRPDEDLWDAVSCASTVWTDKGAFDPEGGKSLYPPRADVELDEGRDAPEVATYPTMNPFDAVSRATPVGDELFTAVWALPAELPDGRYVAWMEVSREFDQNASYDYPAPEVSWGDYGLPYRGQPSIVYRVEIEVSDGETESSTLEWVGYGDPDGVDGELRPPDATITTGVPGSGAERILRSAGEDGDFFLRVKAHGVPDQVAPAAAGTAVVKDLTPTSMTGSFVAPGDDELEGTVAGYQVRYVAGREMSDASWDEATEAAVQIPVDEPGSVHEFTVSGLLPLTSYQIGVRAFDECYNLGPVAVFEVATPRPEGGEVDACFVATAAYGSILANEVVALRGFRDRALRSNLVGELVVEAYYTFGPLAARAIAPSETLRRAARDALRPAVALARRTADRLPAFLR